MKKKSRYFLVFYFAEGTVGQLSLTDKDGEYVNRSIMKKEITILNPRLKNPIITNIIELNKSDFDDFNKTTD